MADEPKRRQHWFYFKDWGAPDPLDPYYKGLLYKAHHDMGALTAIEMYAILQLAQAYIHFAGHNAPNRMIVDQLRLLRTTVKKHYRALGYHGE